MKKRNTSNKNKILKYIVTALIFQLLVLIAADIASPNISAKLINYYSAITTIEPYIIRDLLENITGPIKEVLRNIKEGLE